MKGHRNIESVYIAAASSDLERVDKWRCMLAAAGLTVVSTWPDVIAAVGAPNPRDADREDRKKWSAQDLVEVSTADLLWFLVPSEASGRGAYFEAGYAHALGKVVICSGDTVQSIFTALGSEHTDDLHAFATICRLAKNGAWV